MNLLSKVEISIRHNFGIEEWCQSIDRLDESLSLDIFQPWPSKPLQVSSTVRLFKKNTRTRLLYTFNILNMRERRVTDLANALQYCDGVFEVSYMKDRHSKLDVCVMSYAIHRG